MSHHPADQPAPRPTPEQQAFEAQLAALRPREDRLDRERLMFLAGQASVAPNDATISIAASPGACPQGPMWRTASLGALFGAAAAILVMTLLPATISPAPPSAAHAQPELVIETTAVPAVTLASLDRQPDIPAHLQRWLDAHDPIDLPTAASVDAVAPERPLTSRSIKDALSDLTHAGYSS